jgi:hypothetical protein
LQKIRCLWVRGANNIGQRSIREQEMRITAWWLAGLTLAFSVHAEGPAAKFSPREMNRMLAEMAQWESEWRSKDHISRRAEALRPAYRAEPLRYLNISDEEVRQVQLISRKFLPNALVNISPVVTACPCEEGPNCTAQVYVVATNGENSKGLQLSRLKDQWMVGFVQQWWIRRDGLHAPKADAELPERYRYEKALHELYSEFPVCTSEIAKVEPWK